MTKPNAKARAARENGKRGGRPRSKLPPELLARIGEPPGGDPLALIRWCNDCLGQLTWLTMIGELDRALGATIRAFVSTIIKTVPPDLYADLERQFRQADADQNLDDLGPETEASDVEPALRAKAR